MRLNARKLASLKNEYSIKRRQLAEAFELSIAKRTINCDYDLK